VLTVDNSASVDYKLYRNDSLSDCTIAALGHWFATAAALDGRQFSLTDDEVAAYYLKLTRGADSGLCEVDVLASAQAAGFPLSGEHGLAAWVRLDVGDLDAIRSCVGLFRAVYVGAELPLSAVLDEVWDADGIGTGDKAPGTWAGHAMLVPKYDTLGPTFVTWGRKQRATWAFWRCYVDEAYALLDAERAAVAGVDFAALLSDLKAISAP
jgi:hypothetical protein